MAQRHTRPTADISGYVPFPDERCKRYVENDVWGNRAFHDVIDATAKEVPEKAAVIGPERTVTYAELAENSRRIAAYLVGKLGLEPNDMAVFQLPNCVEFVEAFMACSRAGVIPVQLLPRHREAEARHVFDLTDAKVYFGDAGRYDLGFDYTGMVDGIVDEFAEFDHRIATTTDGRPPEGWRAFEALRGTDWIEDYGTELAETTVNPCDPGVMLLSGGTTGMPKGIPRTYNDYVFQWEWMVEAANVRADWVAFPSVPIGHNASLCCVVGAAFVAGATLAVDPVLKPERLMALIERVDGNYTLPIPTQIIDVLEHPDLEEYDLSSLEVVVSGGQKVPPKVVYEMVDRWDVGFCNIFGMAEGPLICTRPGDDVDTQAHTVGRPIAPDHDEVHIVDESRESTVEQGTPGELKVRGPGFFTGYFRNPAENAENFDDEGWFYTEDVIRRNDDGNYEVFGRIKDTIIRGGESIFTPGIEDELIEHPKIDNVAVIGMPDERLGERPCAFVELDGAADSLRLEEVNEFLGERGLAVFKQPERLEIVDALPRTEVGKISKKQLEEQITHVLKTEGALPEDY